MTHKEKRVTWVKTHFKLDFCQLIFTNAGGATLEGPESFTRRWLVASSNGGLARVGKIFWVGIVYNRVVNPFKIVEEFTLHAVQKSRQKWCRPPSVKISTFSYRRMHPHTLKEHSCYILQGLEFLVLGSRLMDWPPASPDIIFSENNWGIINWKVYHRTSISNGNIFCGR